MQMKVVVYFLKNTVKSSKINIKISINKNNLKTLKFFVDKNILV